MKSEYHNGCPPNIVTPNKLIIILGYPNEYRPAHGDRTTLLT